MSRDDLDNIDRTVLKALRHSDRASLSEVAAMLPNEGKDRLEAARAKLERENLLESVPGSTTGQMQLTAKGAEVANELTDAGDSRGSGGGESLFE